MAQWAPSVRRWALAVSWPGFLRRMAHQPTRAATSSQKKASAAAAAAAAAATRWWWWWCCSSSSSSVTAAPTTTQPSGASGESGGGCGGGSSCGGKWSGAGDAHRVGVAAAGAGAAVGGCGGGSAHVAVVAEQQQPEPAYDCLTWPASDDPALYTVLESVRTGATSSFSGRPAAYVQLLALAVGGCKAAHGEDLRGDHDDENADDYDVDDEEDEDNSDSQGDDDSEEDSEDEEEPWRGKLRMPVETIDALAEKRDALRVQAAEAAEQPDHDEMTAMFESRSASTPT